MGEQLSFLPQGDPVALAIATGGRSPKTIRRYGGAIRSWIRYCEDRQVPVHDAPTDLLVRWLEHRFREHPTETQILVSLAACRMVQQAHAGSSDPLPYLRSARPQLELLCRSLLKEDRQRPRRRADPITGELLKQMVRAARRISVAKGHGWEAQRVVAARDACMLLIGWWGGLRADELARMEWSHLSYEPQGLVLRMLGSKNSEILAALARQENVEFCPVHALDEWKAISETRPQYMGVKACTVGLVFGISVGQVDNRVRAVATRAGLKGRITGHSLRAGFATEASAQDVPDRLVQDHARWKSPAVHATYVREGQLWKKTPTTRIKL